MFEKLKLNKSWIITGSIILLLFVIVGGTISYLSSSTEEVINRFEPSDVTSKVEEKVDGKVKENVRIRNTGDTDAYIRASIVINWTDSDGVILPAAPNEGSYEVTGDYTNAPTTSDQENSWFKGSDGYYYYTSPVVKEASTEELIDTFEAKVPKGYGLTVDIMSSAIQSKGFDQDDKMPVEKEWNVVANDEGLVTKKVGD